MAGLLIFFHLLGAIVWMGGMVFVLFSLRPAAFAELDVPQRPRLLLASLQRFFSLVWLSIALLLASGLGMMLPVGFAHAPLAWHAMFGIGLVMMALFAHIFFAPFMRARRAAARQEWAVVAASLQQMHTLVKVNFTLGWIAIAIVSLWR
jgi:uncharacterized membrane protein